MLRDDGSKIGIERAQIRAASATTSRLRREPDRDDRERTGEKHIQDNRVTTHRSPSFDSVLRGGDCQQVRRTVAGLLGPPGALPGDAVALGEN